jgi:hypothetical protein
MASSRQAGSLGGQAADGRMVELGWWARGARAGATVGGMGMAAGGDSKG